MCAPFSPPLVEQPVVAVLLISGRIRCMLRTLIPAISAASIQVSFQAMAFKITSCSFIIRSVSRAGIGWLSSTPPASYPPAWTGQLTC